MLDRSFPLSIVLRFPIVLVLVLELVLGFYWVGAHPCARALHHPTRLREPWFPDMLITG